MIITEKFVFVHLHKCGGTFINRFIWTFFPSAREIGYHYPVSLLPREYRHLPVFGTVRNPWDFYVSYYVFQQDVLVRARAAAALLSDNEKAMTEARGIDLMNGVDALFECLSRNGALGFRDTLSGFLHLGTPDGMLEQACARMPTRYGSRGPDMPVQQYGFRGMDLLSDELRQIAGTGLGFYTFLFKRMVGDGPVHIIDTQDLRQGLIDFLENASIELTPAMRQYIMNAPAENTSAHAHYSTYYDDKLRQLVGEREAFLIDRYGFEFRDGQDPGSPAINTHTHGRLTA